MFFLVGASWLRQRRTPSSALAIYVALNSVVVRYPRLERTDRKRSHTSTRRGTCEPAWRHSRCVRSASARRRVRCTPRRPDRSRDRANATCSRRRRAPTIFSRDLLEDFELQIALGHPLLQPAVFLLELPQAFDVGGSRLHLGDRFLIGLRRFVTICSSVDRVFLTALSWAEGAILSGSTDPRIARQVSPTSDPCIARGPRT